MVSSRQQRAHSGEARVKAPLADNLDCRSNQKERSSLQSARWDCDLTVYIGNSNRKERSRAPKPCNNISSRRTMARSSISGLFRLTLWMLGLAAVVAVAYLGHLAESPSTGVPNPTTVDVARLARLGDTVSARTAERQDFLLTPARAGRSSISSSAPPSESIAGKIRRTITWLDTVSTPKGAYFWPGSSLCGLPRR